MKKQDPKYEERLVAFIDILGFKEIVKQSEKDPSKVELIYSVLNYLHIPAQTCHPFRFKPAICSG